MTPRHYLLSVAVASLVLVNGCRHNCCKKGCNNPPPVGMPPGGVPAPNLPPQGIPLDPPPSRGAQRPELLLPDSASKTNTSGYSPMPPAPPVPIVVLGEPELPAAKIVEEEAPAKRSAGQPAPPPPANESQVGGFPVGIADFAVVKEGINSGLRPQHLDGWGWLAENKYRSVLYLKRPSENDSSDLQQAEKNGLKYRTLTISPEKLNRDLVKEFIEIVENKDDHPIFVYDYNGTQAGVMWYLYFRKVELLDDEQARIRAGKHGLKTTGNDEQIALWTAVQKLQAAKP